MHMYVCMFVSVTLKNAHISCLGMQFYTTTEYARLPRDCVSGEMVTDKQVVRARRLTAHRKQRKRERTHWLEINE